jgi:hypothetical protein
MLSLGHQVAKGLSSCGPRLNGWQTICCGIKSAPVGLPAFDLDFEKRRLASVLGMTPENLSRAFKGLQPYGVTVEGTRITIGDQADLETVCKAQSAD